MGFLPFLIRKSLLQKIALVFLGILLGSAGTIAHIGRQVDQLTNTKHELREQLINLQGELEQVRESLSQHQEPVITSMAIRVEFLNLKLLRLEEDSLRLSIEKQIKEILKNLMGKEIDKLDPALIPWMVENRIIEAEGHTFRIKVTLLVLTEKVYLVVQAQPIPKQP